MWMNTINFYQIFLYRKATKIQPTNVATKCAIKSRDRLERILTMVYVEQNSQNFSGLFPSSGIPKNTTE
jgi:hypothetical protein